MLQQILTFPNLIGVCPTCPSCNIIFMDVLALAPAFEGLVAAAARSNVPLPYHYRGSGTCKKNAEWIEPGSNAETPKQWHKNCHAPGLSIATQNIFAYALVQANKKTS